MFAEESNNQPVCLLPPAWHEWLLESVARGCDPEVVMEMLLVDGGFPEDVAKIALEEAFGKDIFPADAKLPDVNTRVNTVDLDGRIANILITVRNPRIVLLDNFLTHEECDELIQSAQKYLKKSMVIDDDKAVDVQNDARTSAGAMFKRGETELILTIEKRLADLCNWPLDHGEPIQVLRYELNEEYRPHFDWFDPDKPGHRMRMVRGGQRVATVILYLSDVAEGGSTVFPKLGLEVRPHKGSALFFANLGSDGFPNEKSFHGGMPVIRGVKFIATKWMRERQY